MVAWKTETDFSEMHTVLIISQDFEMAAVWETLFRQKNCFVICEKTPQDALQAAHLLHPSLIILSLDMPRWECLSLCRELRSTTNGTLLLLSPANADENIFDYYHAGVNEILAPPINHMALLVKSMAWLVQQEWATPRVYTSQMQE